MSSPFKDKNILVTGGTGSFGQKFTEILLKDHEPRSIRIYSRSELKQVEMDRKFNDSRLRFFIGDVRDRDRLYRAMNGVDLVVHAAALKHVPVCEYNPIEAIRTNVDGAVNVIDCAIDNKVERVVAVSTDKAVHPVNLYGATKLVSEKLIIQANSYSGLRNTKFCVVRYGNVIGSSGSVVPLFMKQKKEGELTLTDERMTRFWITLEEGVKLVITALQDMEGGETFVPKIPSTKITDLAEVIAPEAKCKTIGIRPGEKLHEVLITKEEARHTVELDNHYVIKPEFKFWSKEDNTSNQKRPPEGFQFSSDANDWWLTKDELRRILVKEGWMQK